MARFVLSAKAAAALRDIARYPAEQWGQDQTRLYLDALEARLSALAETPGAGRLRPELAEGLRFFPFESHVVFFVEIAGGIAIVRLLHRRRDVEGQF